MTGYKSKKAAAQALAQPEQEPVEYCTAYYCAGDCGQPHNQKEMQEFLRAQPAQEPVAWMNKHGDCKSAVFIEAEASAKEEYNIPLYTNQILEKNT